MTVLIGRLDSSGGTIAQGLELDAIAAVVLAGTSLFGGRGSIRGSLLGAVLWRRSAMAWICFRFHRSCNS